MIQKPEAGRGLVGVAGGGRQRAEDGVENLTALLLQRIHEKLIGRRRADKIFA